MRKQVFYVNSCGSRALHSLCGAQISIWYHFTYPEAFFFFNISCSARLLIINSVSFHMPEKVFMSPSVFKEVFLGCRRLDGCFNSFRALKTFRCHLACLCSAVIPIFFQIRMKHEIYISYAFFLPGCFYIFLFITGFKRFD